MVTAHRNLLRVRIRLRRRASIFGPIKGHIRLTRRLRPDIIVMDIDMRDVHIPLCPSAPPNACSSAATEWVGQRRTRRENVGDAITLSRCIDRSGFDHSPTLDPKRGRMLTTSARLCAGAVLSGSRDRGPTFPEVTYVDGRVCTQGLSVGPVDGFTGNGRSAPGVAYRGDRPSGGGG